VGVDAGTPKVVPVETKKVGLLAWNNTVTAQRNRWLQRSAFGLLAVLLERSHRLGFVLVGIITCLLRYQLRAFLAEAVETTPQLFPGESCADRWPQSGRRRKALKHRPKAMAAPK